MKSNKIKLLIFSRLQDPCRDIHVRMPWHTQFGQLDFLSYATACLFSCPSIVFFVARMPRHKTVHATTYCLIFSNILPNATACYILPFSFSTQAAACLVLPISAFSTCHSMQSNVLRHAFWCVSNSTIKLFLLFKR